MDVDHRQVWLRNPSEQANVTGSPTASTCATMALPTNGRVILDTTVGEIEIELWSKVRIYPLTATTIPSSFVPGNAKSMSEFPCARHGGFVSSS